MGEDPNPCLAALSFATANCIRIRIERDFGRNQVIRVIQEKSCCVPILCSNSNLPLVCLALNALDTGHVDVGNALLKEIGRQLFPIGHELGSSDGSCCFSFKCSDDTRLHLTKAVLTFGTDING